MFTPNLMEIYDELKELGKFEIVLITHDEDENSFNEYFSKMPWLAIPFSDSDTHKKLNKLFNVNGIPQLTILDQNGNVLTNEGVEIIIEHGADGYPFTREHIEKIIERKERNQSLQSLLVSTSLDYVIKKETVAALEGGTVGLYFMGVTNEKCIAFNSKLVEVYTELKEEGAIFEIVMIPVVDDYDETLVWNALKDHPWFSLPPNDSRCDKLVYYFKIYDYPTIVAIGPDGKTLHSNIVDAIQEHGSRAYPFTPEKFEELEEIKKAKRELESLLVSKDSDFVIQNDGAKCNEILVSCHFRFKYPVLLEKLYYFTFPPIRVPHAALSCPYS
ncbi:hypothetical protein ACJIZ3_005100 [Penstemon smallii]|uniref:protein-disulfide reductase n=1 Tax=Penstemon smallii TaxID=265156 RepID=A0ABD3S3Y2_9LAMI